MTSQHHEITSFFVDASKALEELPHVKGKLNQAEEELAICRDISHGKDGRIETLQATIDELTRKAVNLANERDAAEFAALEAKDQADKLIASIRGVMKGAEAADSILNPPMVESQPTSSSGAEPSGDKAVESVPYAEPASPPSEPSSHSGTDAAQAPQSEGSERPLDVSTAPLSAGVPTESAKTPNDAGSPSKPHANRDYWEKPDHMTWREWVDGGGECAPYVHLDHDGSQH